MGVCRVLILDDHPLFRQGLRRVVDSDPRFRVVGEVGDTPSAFAFLASNEVDLITVDLTLARGSGLEFIQTVRRQHPAVRMLALSMCDPALYAARALRAGAQGFIGKQEPADAVLRALAAVHAGKLVADEDLKDQLLQQALQGVGPTAPDALTDRELEVLRLIGAGSETADIAEALGLSSKTVESHRTNIARKLGVRGTAGLVRAAVLRLGMPVGDDGP